MISLCRSYPWLSLAIACLLAPAAWAAPKLPTESFQYNRDIRPILVENCFACHGQDKAARKKGLRLDVREEAIKLAAILPGKPDESGMIDRIFSDNPKQIMPPPKSHKKLTAAQKDVLKCWVAAGAEYQPHWSFIAPKRPPLPAVKNSAWVRNPIDRFILAALEERGLSPALEADRRTLARRLSLDMTGLPPAPVDVEAFVKDTSPDAYEKYVDSLLRSPHWGEHRGRYWLDVARYADTHGIHMDNFRENWAYREWVIRALNRNMPFDEFTIEQLAGDLLPSRTLDQVVASGFNRCNITTSEGGAIDEEYLVLYARDRTETLSQVWFGLTAGCAVCHDHKFDPLSQKEFYSLSAFFNNTTQAAMDGNIKDTPPTVFVPRSEDRVRWEALPKDRAAVQHQMEARRAGAQSGLETWLKNFKPDALGPLPAQGLRAHVPLVEGEGKAVSLTLDNKPRSVPLPPGTAWDVGLLAARALKPQNGVTLEVADIGDFDTPQPFSFGAWVKVPSNAPFGAVFARMDNTKLYRGWDLYVEGGKVGAHLVNRWPEDALKVLTQAPIPAGQWNHVFVTYDGSAKAAGVHVYVNGVQQPTMVLNDSLKSTIRTTVPWKVGQRHTTERLNGVLVQEVRIYGRSLPAAEVQRLGSNAQRIAAIVAKPAAEHSDVEKKELLELYLTTADKAYIDLTAKLQALAGEESAIKGRGTLAHVMQEKQQKAMAYVLFRGDYDKRRDPVTPDTPRVLPPIPPGVPKDRLALARWLLSPEHPLTTRVTVNRFWQELFGTGIVRTSGDFGAAGEPPSNQELLDWMAVELRESGWDVKKFFKLLVMSATYRQSAAATPEKLEKDPANRLLSRGPRYRMDAEMVRDYALAASGLLVRKLGGPSVRPYQPDGVWEAVAMIGSNTRDYVRDNGEKLYRRSMYTFWKRAAPPASMEIFNAPTREVCTVRRERTNTPLQALVTLNDPQFVEAARVLAQTAVKQGGDKAEGRIDFIVRRLLSRPLRAEEQKVVKANLDELLAFYKGHAEDAKKLLAVGEAKVDGSLDPAAVAAYAMLVNELMNLDEVLNK
jgi:hypothetical protein